MGTGHIHDNYDLLYVFSDTQPISNALPNNPSTVPTPTNTIQPSNNSLSYVCVPKPQASIHFPCHLHSVDRLETVAFDQKSAMDVKRVGDSNKGPRNSLGPYDNVTNDGDHPTSTGRSAKNYCENGFSGVLLTPRPR